MTLRKSLKNKLPHPKKPRTQLVFEAEILNGLKPIVSQELAAILGDQVNILITPREDQVTFTTARTDLLKYLRTPLALFLLVNFKIPSPTNLLKPEHFSRLLHAIRGVQARQAFRSFRLSAAGSDSPFFKQLGQELQKHTRLKIDPENGEMVLRFRRSLISASGWDVLIRLTLRPMSARPWRTANVPGALNGTLAAAMVLLSKPTPHDVVCNPMCGSGTLLIERHFCENYDKLHGFDLSSEMLAAAKQNLSEIKIPAVLVKHDVLKGFAQFGPFDVMLCDLPYGRLVGKKQDLGLLYESFLRSAWEAGSPQARLVVISQEVKLLDNILKRQKAHWRIMERIRVKQADFLPVVISCAKVSPGSPFDCAF